MRKGPTVFKKKWLILGLTCLMMPFYQNMSGFDDGSFISDSSDSAMDIRDYAPERPAGYLENPMAGYVPDHFSGNNMNDVGQSLLDHNFEEINRRTEFLGASFFESGSSSFNPEKEPMNANTVLNGRRLDSSKLRLNMVGPAKLKLSYHLASNDGAGWEMSCQNQGQGVNLQMNHPLNSHMQVGLSHETEARTSQVKMGISW